MVNSFHNRNGRTSDTSDIDLIVVGGPLRIVEKISDKVIGTEIQRRRRMDPKMEG